VAAFFYRLTHHEGAKNGYFWGWKCRCFCVFLPRIDFCTRHLRTTRHGLRPPCCGATLASLVAGGISAALLRCCGCKRKWWWLRGQPVCAGLGLRVVSARAVSTLGCVSTAVCTHKRAHKQAPVPVPLGVPGNGVEGRLPRGGRGRCGSHPRQLHSCRPELEPDSEWRTSHLVPAAGQPVPISMSRHRPHQLPRRSAQP